MHPLRQTADARARDAADAADAFVRTQELAMANAIPPAMANALPPAINAFAPFARASVFGDVRDLYRHAPTARIGANYTPSAHARLLERPRKAPPVTKRTGMETNAEILRMPAPAYPLSLIHI